ncbi:hypothetical protein GCM10022206_52620 [Streptomyces chiangmaiensis]
MRGTVLERLEALKARLSRPTPPPLEGQQTIDLPGQGQEKEAAQATRPPRRP